MYFDHNNNSYPDSTPLICYSGSSADFQPQPDHRVTLLKVPEIADEPTETANGEPIVPETSKRLSR